MGQNSIFSTRGVSLTYVLAIMMIIFGIISAETIISNYVSVEDAFLLLVGKTLIILFGLALLLYPKKNNMIAIGFYAIGLGIDRIFRSLNEVTSPKDTVFLLGLIMLALGCSLIYCGISYLRGTSRNTTRVVIITSIIVVGYIVYVMFMLYWGLSWQTIVENDRDIIVMILMYATYVAVLNTKEVHNNIPVEKIHANLDNIANRIYAGTEISISDEDLALLKDGFDGAQSWVSVGMDTPVESETMIVLNTGDGCRRATVQKWADDEGVYLTMLGDCHSSFVSGYRSHILSIKAVDGGWDDCSAVELFDSKGKCARFTISRSVSR